MLKMKEICRILFSFILILTFWAIFSAQRSSGPNGEVEEKGENEIKIVNLTLRSGYLLIVYAVIIILG